MNKKRTLRWSRVLILVLSAILLISVPVLVYHQFFKSEQADPVVEDDTSKEIKALKLKGYPEEIALSVSKLTDKEKKNYLLDNDYEATTTSLLLNKYADFNKLERYKKYYTSHNNLKTDDIILMVNLHLDFAFYDDTEKVSNPNNLLVIVNKYFYLSSDYQPSDLVEIKPELNGRSDGMKVLARAQAVEAFYKMNEAMEDEIGVVAKASTAFRDYAFQEYLYNFYVSTIGVEKADLESARPGYSEHQTGLAIDVNANGEDIESFVHSKQSEWVIKNAHLYGFIVRYQKETTEITGYRAEEWHLRYVGVEPATKIYSEGISLEEYVMRTKYDK